MQHRVRKLTTVLAALVLLLGGVTAAPVEATTQFQSGDVFISTDAPNVEWWQGSTKVATLTPGGAPFDGAFDSAGNFYVPTSSGGVIKKYDNTGSNPTNVAGTFVSPTSMFIQADGTMYVADDDGSGNGVIRKLGTAAHVYTNIGVTTGNGVYMDMASDGCTIYLVTGGDSVYTYNVCTGSSGTLVTYTGRQFWGVRALPNNGGLMVAADQSVMKLDASGATVQSYTVSGSTNFFISVHLDPDGSSFWALAGKTAYKLSLATGGSNLTASATVTASSGNNGQGLTIYGEAVTSGGGGATDNVAPTTTASVSPAANGAGWNNSDVTVSISATDSAQSGVSASGVVYTGVTLDSASQTCSGASCAVYVTTDGTHTLTYYSQDAAGNTESTHTLTVKLDKTAPTITMTPDRSANANGWYNGNVTFGNSCTDSGSGVTGCDQGATTTVATEGAPTTATVTATDAAGNQGSASASVYLDKTAPSISGAASPAANANGWNNSDVTVTWTCGDPLSGIATCSSPTTLSSDGAGQSVIGTATDKAGNSNTSSVGPVNIDKAPPTAAISAPSAGSYVYGTLNVTGTASDANLTGWTLERAASGTSTWAAVYTATAAVSGGTLYGLDTTGLADGGYDLRLTATDLAGDSTQSSTVAVYVDNTLPTAAISAPSASSTVYGTVTITGTASDANLTGWALAYAASGSSTWTALNSGTSTVSGGTLGSLDSTALADGDYDLRLTATDAASHSSTSTVTVHVNNTAADGSGTMAITSGPASVSGGQSGLAYTFTYTAATGGMSGGAVDLVIPSGWTAPSGSNVTVSAGSATYSSQTIQVTGVTLTGGGTLTVGYTGTAPTPASAAAAVYTFAASQASLSGHTLVGLASSPSVAVYAADGSGTLGVSPSRVFSGTTADFSFTYTAAAGGLNGGTLTLTIPNGWTAPSLTSPQGAVTASAGTLSLSGQAVTVSGLNLAASTTLTVQYTAVTVPSAPGPYTFAVQERSTAAGQATAVAQSPVVTVAFPSLVGLSVSGPTQVTAGAPATYSAIGTYDNNKVAPIPATWSASGGSFSGSTWTAPGTPGAYSVTATYASFAASLNVVVVVGPPAALQISPASGQVTAGGTVGFTATVADAAGNPLSDAAVNWAATGGSMHGSTWTAPATPGSYTISVSLGSLSATATFTVPAAATGGGDTGGNDGGSNGGTGGTGGSGGSNAGGCTGDGVSVAVGCQSQQPGANGSPSVTVTVDSSKVDVGSDLHIDLSLTNVSTDSGNLSVGIKSASIPTTVLDGLGHAGNAVTIDAGSATITIPPAAVTGTQPVQAAEQSGDWVSVDVSVQAIPPEQAAHSGVPEAGSLQIALGTAIRGGLAPIGNVLSFHADAVVTSADGTTTRTPITHFASPLTVRIPFDAAAVAHPERLGVYRLNPQTGQWEFRGGKVNLAGGYVEIDLQSFSIYAVLSCSKTFTDIPGHWAQSDIELMACRDVVKGVTETQFDPDGMVTRAQFAALLIRALDVTPYSGGGQSFQDVGSGDWYYQAVETAARAGLIVGYAGNFRPEDQISRQELSLMLVRAAAYESKAIALGGDEAQAIRAGFTDGSDIADWAAQAVAQASKAALMTGRGGATFAPAANATRAEAVVVLERLLRYLGTL